MEVEGGSEFAKKLRNRKDCSIHAASARGTTKRKIVPEISCYKQTPAPLQPRCAPSSAALSATRYQSRSVSISPNWANFSRAVEVTDFLLKNRKCSFPAALSLKNSFCFISLSSYRELLFAKQGSHLPASK